MVETLSNTYTSQAEIERVWGETGVDLRTDDLVDTATLFTEIVAEATDTINIYLTRRYTPATLENHAWIRRAATWIGCYLLSRRRGNPGQYYEEYQRIIDILEKIQANVQDLPRAIVRADSVPAGTNYTVDERYNQTKVRVQQATSTAQPYSEAHTDLIPPSQGI